MTIRPYNIMDSYAPNWERKNPLYYMVGSSCASKTIHTSIVAIACGTVVAHNDDHHDAEASCKTTSSRA